MDNATHSKYGPVVLTFIIIFVFSILTIGLATQWTFDLFQPQFLWKAYNHYFLSMLDGRFDIPVEAIGREGGFFNGKAYMYYGLLPILVRAILYPFVELDQTSVSYFSVLFFTLLGHIVLQISMVSFYLKNRLGDHQRVKDFMLIAVSSILWFGSASFMISQNATIYHEPYAASLCLAYVYFAFLIKDNFFLNENVRVSLLPYAIIAGLCVHARMPTALTLYLVTGLLILLQTVRAIRSEGSSLGLLAIILKSIRLFWPAILFMGAFGLSILWLNYAKYGNPLSFMGGNYGYFFLEGYSARRCNVIPQSDFQDILRIIPNIVVYLTGSADLHWSLTWHLATGFGRLEEPLIPLALLWPLPIVCFLCVLITLIKGVNQNKNRVLLIAIVVFSVGAFFQLKYPTITHRYTAELWIPIFLSVLFVWFNFTKQSTQIVLNGRLFAFKYMIFGLLLLIGIGSQLYFALTNKYYLEDGPVLSHHDFHYSATDNQFLGTLTPSKIKAFYVEFRQSKAEKCKALLEE